MISIHAIYKNGRKTIFPDTFKFPGGEIQINADDFDAEGVKAVSIIADLRNSDDVMSLFLVTDAIRRRAGSVTPIVLYLPYVPYARQDRVCNPGEALAIKVFCDLINNQNYDEVVIIDPHSDVTGALLNNVTIIDASAAVDQVLKLIGYPTDITLVSPDAGAMKKTQNIAKRFNISNVVFADKVRNTRTGEIVHTSLQGRIWPGVPVLVVDDICDGGRTFIEIAKEIRASGVSSNPLYLYVTHGIFSKGVEPLLEHYKKVFTTNDWTDSKNPAVVVVPPQFF